MRCEAQASGHWPGCKPFPQVPAECEKSPSLWRHVQERTSSWDATCPAPWTASPMWWSGSSMECPSPSSSTFASTLLMWTRNMLVREELPALSMWENSFTIMSVSKCWFKSKLSSLSVLTLMLLTFLHNHIQGGGLKIWIIRTLRHWQTEQESKWLGWIVKILIRTEHRCVGERRSRTRCSAGNL